MRYNICFQKLPSLVEIRRGNIFTTYLPRSNQRFIGWRRDFSLVAIEKNVCGIKSLRVT